MWFALREKVVEMTRVCEGWEKKETINRPYAPGWPKIINKEGVIGKQYFEVNHTWHFGSD